MIPQAELQFVTHRNHYLFSDYYLNHRAAERQEWQALDARPHMAALRQLWTQRQAALHNANEAQTEADWIRPVLDLLGHRYTTQVSLTTPQGVKTPDYILCPDGATRTAVQTLGRPAVEADLAAALAVADAKAWDRPLDRSLPGAGVKTLHQHPALQIDFYIRHAGLPWGVLTNGRLWQLFHKDSSKKLDVYYEVDLPALLEADDAEAFKYFWLFFRREAFIPGSAAPGAPAWLDLVLAESAAYQQGVSDGLKAQVYEALHSLAQGFLDFPGNKLAADPASLQALYDHSLLVLYRLLFILYAEDRDLLPVRTNTAYRESYSLHALKRRIAEEIDRGQPAVASMSGLWSRLRELWRVIDQGNGQLGVPAYNGGLFKAANHPWLEQQRVGDLHLRAAIDLLARTRDPKTGAREFVDYRDLEIRHLGSIYEGLLEYRVVVDSRPLGFPETPRVSLLTDKGERKATGSYYTPDAIVQYIVEHTVGSALAEAAAPFLHADGSVRDAAGLERAVLGVNVLDPAMGSGHFLVAAADAMARFLVEKGVGAETEQAGGGEGESQLAYWRRRVAQACIYGVDLNPLAVELAKLSLWLATVSQDKPLSFLDHHLRCGNSLIGARVADLPLGAAPNGQVVKERRAAYKARQAAQKREEAARAAGQLTMLDDSMFVGAMHTASGMMRMIEDLGSETLADVRKAEEVYRDSVRAVTERSRLLADVWTARRFGLALDDATWGGLSRYILHGGFETPSYQAIIDQARAIAEQRRFFHWELEFPEVFFDGYGRLLKEGAGFESVIGNPPWKSIPADSADKDALQSIFRSVFQGEMNYYVLFLAATADLVKMDGHVGQLVPNTWLINLTNELIRRNLLSTMALRRLHILCKEVFADAPDTIPVIYVATRTGDSSSIGQCRIFVVDDALLGDDRFLVKHSWEDTGNQARWFTRPFHQLSPYDTDANLALSSRLENLSVLLGEIARASDGIYKSTVERHKLTTGGDMDRPVIESAAQTNRYWIRWQGAFIPEELWRQHVALHNGPKLVLHAARKPKLERQLVIAYLEEDFYFSNRFVIIKPSASLSYSPLYLTAVLNSAPLNYYHRFRFPITDIDAYMLHQLPIRRIDFTTPANERQRLAEKGRRLYSQFCTKWDYACVLGFVEHELAQQPERSDVVHDLLAFLAEQMIELNKQRQKLEKAIDPFKFLDRNAPCQPLPKVFAAGIKYGELVRSPNPSGLGDPKGLDAVRHDVEGLRLVVLGGQQVELQALLKQRSPADGWSGWQYEADGKSIMRAWTPVYRFELDPAQIRFYTHALPVVDQFTHSGKFPGGKTKTAMQKLQAAKLPVFDPSLDLAPLDELHAELAAARTQIERTDRLIDQVVYRLYGLTEEEIAVVEER